MMEIRCAQCGHLGNAKEIRPRPDGMVLVCARCGHEHILSVGGEASAAPAAPVTPALPTATSAKPERDIWLTPQAMKRLVPEPGDGPRCRKCAHLLDPDEDNCARCGLDIVESRRWPEGEAPWERAPRGSEAEFERAELLWRAAEASWDAESVAKFADYARDSGLHEMAIRHLRFRLVDSPDDAIALGHLKVLADALQSRYVVAKAREEMSAQAFSEGVGRLRGALVLAVIFFWGGIFLLFFGLFVDNCR
jgi:hypothetical protein